MSSKNQLGGGTLGLRERLAELSRADRVRGQRMQSQSGWGLATALV